MLKCGLFLKIMDTSTDVLDLFLGYGMVASAALIGLISGILDDATVASIGQFLRIMDFCDGYFLDLF
jgi:hypothetical protein